MSDRMRRVNSVVRQVLAEEVEILKDPRLTLVTITDVETAPNLRHAMVYYSTLEADAVEGAREALRSAAPRLRRALGRQVRLKYTPALEFELDEGVAGGERIDAILREIARNRGEEE